MIPADLEIWGLKVKVYNNPAAACVVQIEFIYNIFHLWNIEQCLEMYFYQSV